MKPLTVIAYLRTILVLCVLALLSQGALLWQHLEIKAAVQTVLEKDRMALAADIPIVCEGVTVATITVTHQEYDENETKAQWRARCLEERDDCVEAWCTDPTDGGQ